MRQRSTVPLLAVILAAVRSRGKSFSQSLASHAICLPDTRMRMLCLYSQPFLDLSFSSLLSAAFPPHILTHSNLTCLCSFYIVSSCIYIYMSSICFLHQFLYIFPPLTPSRFSHFLLSIHQPHLSVVSESR